MPTDPKAAPALLVLLVGEALSHLSAKHSVAESSIRADYLTGQPAVVAQVNHLVQLGWVVAHGAAA